MSPPPEFNVLESTIGVLRSHRIWPRKGQAFNPNRSYHIIMFVFMCSHLPLACGTIGHIRFALKVKHSELLAEDVSILSSMLGTFYMIILVTLKQNQMACLYKDLSNFQEFGKPDNFDEVNKKLKLISYLYGWYCGAGTWIYGIISILQTARCKRLNVEFQVNDICGLFLPAMFPFDIDFFPAKQILILCQGYSAFTLLRSTATISFGAFEVAQHVILRIRHLNRLISEIFDLDDYEERRKRLNFCARYHVDVIRIYNDFDSCYSSIMGLHITLTGVIFGCIMNQMMQQMDLKCILHITGWLIALFIVCIGGQTLTDESDEIATTIYDTKWDNVEEDIKNDLKLMLLQSQRPFQLHATVQVLSLELFVAILKTSYSYMTLLSQTT